MPEESRPQGAHVARLWRRTGAASRGANIAAAAGLRLTKSCIKPTETMTRSDDSLTKTGAGSTSDPLSVKAVKRNSGIGAYA